MLRLDSAVSGYGKAQVLREVSVSVAPGEVVAVVGGNGAGKTTLARTIAGGVALWRGTLRVDDRDLTNTHPELRGAAGVVMCPEGRRILSTVTVEENLRLGATPLRRRLGAAAARVATREGLAESYERFPILKERRLHRGGALSGGQQQMLAIARALMARPSYLLLDEPSLGLAPTIIQDVYRTLADLRVAGLGVLLIEEGATRALAFADRGVVMKNGAVVLDGPAHVLAADEELASTYLGVREES